MRDTPVYALGLDLDDAADKKRAGSVVQAMMKEGALVEVEERDPVRRGKFVRAA